MDVSRLLLSEVTDIQTNHDRLVIADMRSEMQPKDGDELSQKYETIHQKILNLGTNIFESH